LHFLYKAMGMILPHADRSYTAGPTRF